MNLEMIQPKNKTEDLLLSFTKNGETPKKQTHRKSQETLEFKVTKPREPFSKKPSSNLGHDSRQMIGLTSLEIYISIFIKTEEYSKFKYYQDFNDRLT